MLGRPMNPVLSRELRVRLRGRQAWVLLTTYLVLLAAIVFVVYQSKSGSGFGGDPFAAPSPTRFATVGRTIFEWLVLFMLLLVLFLVPGFTAGAVAGERERQTLVPLQVTLLRPWQIVTGKLLASFAYLALLVLATAPFLAVAYLIGGVTMASVLKSVAVVLFVGLCMSALTVCCSVVFKRVQIATVVSYAVVLLLLVGTLLVWAAANVVDRSRGSDPADAPAEILALNPLFFAADVLADEDVNVGIIDSPFEPMVDVLLRDRYGDGFTGVDGGFFGGGPVPVGRAIALGPGGGRIIGNAGFGVAQQQPIIGFDREGNPIFASDDDGFPFWALSAIGLYVLAVAGGLLAVRRLRTPAVTER